MRRVRVRKPFVTDGSERDRVTTACREGAVSITPSLTRRRQCAPLIQSEQGFMMGLQPSFGEAVA